MPCRLEATRDALNRIPVDLVIIKNHCLFGYVLSSPLFSSIHHALIALENCTTPTNTMKAIFNTTEIIILVFQSCNTVEDGLSLASTCRFLAAIWRTHASTILYRLIEAQTPGFDQALLAVS